LQLISNANVLGRKKLDELTKRQTDAVRELILERDRQCLTGRVEGKEWGELTERSGHKQTEKRPRDGKEGFRETDTQRKGDTWTDDEEVEES